MSERKPFFVLSIDEIRKLETRQTDLVNLIKKINRIPIFDLFPIFTSLLPRLDFELTFSQRKIFVSVLPRLDNSVVNEIVSCYVQDIRDISKKALLLCSGHARSIEFIDKNINFQKPSKESFFTNFTTIISIGFVFESLVNQKTFWKWLCIPFLNLTGRFKKIIGEKDGKNVRLSDFIIEGILFNSDNYTSKHYFYPYFSPKHLKTSPIVLYNYSKLFSRGENNKDISSSLNCLIVDSFSKKTDFEKFETFNAHFLILLLQCRSSLIDQFYINSKSNSIFLTFQKFK